MAEWRVYLRKPNLRRGALIEDFQQLDLVPRWNDVGTWAIDLDARLPYARQLATPGYGIEVVNSAGVVLSGDMRHVKRTRTEDRSRLVVSGYDDNVWLYRRVAHPQPGTATPPYSSSGYDMSNDVASTVLGYYVDRNAGPAALAVRRVPGLTIGSYPAAGTTVFGRARWQRLLVLLQELALTGGGLGFRITKTGTSAREFTVWEPEDLTSRVRFSTGLGNLAGYEYEDQAPTFNYVYMGGSGEGVTRTIREGLYVDSVVDWGRIEEFRDRRDTDDLSELDQHISQALAEGVGQVGLRLTPAETNNLRYLVHYNLGDRVTAVLDGVVVRDQVTEVRIKLTPEGPSTLPAITSPGGNVPEVLRLVRALRATERRLENLERR